MCWRNLRVWIAAIAIGLTAAACGGSTSDATAEEPDATTEPVVAAEEPEASTESSAPAEASTESSAPIEADEAVEADEPVVADQPDESVAPAEETVTEVSPLFEGSFVDLNGDSIDLASFEGQDVVLWFWAPW